MDRIRKGSIILLLLTFIYTKGEVTVENGDYTNVLVSFSPTVAPEKGKEMLENVQGIMTEASEVLKNAIGLGIRKVTFLLPIAWETSEWENITIGSPSVEQTNSATDILVDGVTDSAFGKYPIAMQHGGCGVPGHRIDIPGSFLTADVAFPKGKLLAREWLKYRYGVFDENGFAGDEMYPLFYGIPGDPSEEVRITDCTDQPVNYTFRDVKEMDCVLKIDDQTGLPLADIEGCYIYPDQESIENVSSSLMYFQEKMPNMEHICGEKEHPHSSTSPNKQNSLCQGKSIWEVLKMSSDFSSGRADEVSEGSSEIEFAYVQERNPKVFVAWDNTQKLALKEAMIFRAIGRLLYDLPTGSKYALYPYDNEEESTDEIPLVELTSWPEGRDKSITSDFASDADACVTCAISKAISTLSADDSLKGSVIVMAASKPTEDEELLKKIEKTQLCIIIIGFTNLGPTSEDFQKYLSSSPCGGFYELSTEEGDEIVFDKLYHAMESVLPRLTANTVTTTIKTDYVSAEKEMLIPSDETAAKYTLWFIGKSPEVKNFICKSNDNPVTLKKDVDQNFVALSFEPTKSDVSCALRVKGMNPVLTQVQMTTKPGEYFDSQIWIKDTTVSSQQQMPIILYTSVSFGPYPVKNAEVKATVTSHDGQSFVLDLYDDGRGDPDITANDGIYSRYFTEFTTAGEYNVQIKVSDNGGQARAGKEGSERCCGSIVKTIDSNDFSLGTFEKTYETSFKVISGKPPYGYKPSRIVDLRVASINTSQVVLQWTAPGGEADSGTATSYEFKISCKPENCSEDGKLPRWVKVKNQPKPEVHGSKQNATIMFIKDSPTEIMTFLGIKSVNEKGQYSDVSNYVPVIWISDAQQEITTVEIQIPKEKPLNQSTIGAIVGSIVVIIILVICISVAIYCCNIKPKYTKEEVNEIEKTYTNDINNDVKISKSFKATNHFDTNSSMRRVESFPVILYTHDQIRDFRKKNKDPPLYKSDVAPKQWKSLDGLSNSKLRGKKDDENRSLGSSSTVHVDDDNIISQEMKQLDDNISQDSVLKGEKTAKF